MQQTEDLATKLDNYSETPLREIFNASFVLKTQNSTACD